MNPILRNRTALVMYGVVMACFATLYAILTAKGSGLPTIGCAVGGAAYWLACSLAGIAVHSIIKYAIPTGNGIVRGFIVTSSCAMAIVLVTGAESLAVYAALGHLGEFVPLLPLKAFVSLLAFVALSLFYRRSNSIEDKPEETVPETMNAPRPEDVMERISLKNGPKIKVISIDEIEYLQADGDYVAIVSNGERWLKEQTMKHFEEHLPADRFIRIHRSYIVHSGKISRIERYGTLYQVVLLNGEKIKVSATGYKLMKERLHL